MKKNATTVRLALTGVLLVFCGHPLFAQESSHVPKDLVRTHFTRADGLPGSVVDRIEQTPDGFLWLITNGVNLVRFDGKNFYIFDGRIETLAVAPDGGLWVGARTGLMRVPPSMLNQFELTGLPSLQPEPGKESAFGRLLFSASGTLWAGTRDGLFRYDGDRFVAVGPRVSIVDFEAGRDGHLMVVTRQGFGELDGTELVPRPAVSNQLGGKVDIFHAMRDRRGNTWYSTALGVARETDGRFERLGTFGPGGGHAAFRTYEDLAGTVWIAKEEGLFRATPTGLELVAADLAGNKVRSLYADRDSNLWVGTNGDGLYRFKHSAVRTFTTDDGLPNNLIQTVFAARDGTVWTGANCGGLSRFDGTSFTTFNEKNGLLNSCVWGIAEDNTGDLWIATYGGGAFRYHNGTFTQYAKKDGIADDRVRNVLITPDGAVWLATPGGMSRLQDGKIRNFTAADGLSSTSIIRALADKAGVIWASSRLGLDRLVGDRFENLASVPKSVVIPLGWDRDGCFFVTVDPMSAMLRLDKGRADTVQELRNPSDMIETAKGELWFGGRRALFRLQPGAVERVRQHDEPLEFETFSVADGLPAADLSVGQHSLALTGNDTLWAATLQGLARIDLRRLPVTDGKPSIYLRSLTIGRNTQRPSRDIVVPRGTSHVQIDFAAVEISSPEKIRLQYRLDGVDSEWLDAGPDARATYSTLPVGSHAFQVRASNRHGIWDRQGVVFTITQQPFFYQTRWFAAAMAVLGLLIAAAIYRVRVRQISRAMSARFDERLAERTRVARELHDTFLQTVQGSKMVADHALKDPADHARAVRALEQLSAWLAQATEEGRAALNSLRASTTEKNNLAEAFRRAIDECRGESSIEISFSVKGDFREMHPVARDEIYRIGYEAIRNSCAHSGGDRLEVTLEFAHDLTLRISDNGVGIDPEIVVTGQEGHFGLRGMRERAERIGSKFTLVSSPGSGTVITLVVPGRSVFRSPRPDWSERLKSLFSRD